MPPLPPAIHTSCPHLGQTHWVARADPVDVTPGGASCVAGQGRPVPMTGIEAGCVRPSQGPREWDRAPGTLTTFLPLPQGECGCKNRLRRVAPRSWWDCAPVDSPGRCRRFADRPADPYPGSMPAPAGLLHAVLMATISVNRPVNHTVRWSAPQVLPEVAAADTPADPATRHQPPRVTGKARAHRTTRPVHRPPMTGDTDREQAHFPAEQPQARQDARLSAAHADARRSRHPRCAPPQGSRGAVRLILPS